MSKFQIGRIYECRSACDYDCIFSYTVIARTARRMTIKDRHGRQRLVGVKVDGYGCEFAYPQGTYSMCPVIRAEKAIPLPATTHQASGAVH